ncbi:hypothetical protein B0A48_03677 [Cryoendolithus antarcticus]|uniref:Uncharacterized protein n=1 Tax=Cryoendolithus antarcticus TaxID=1507870 RepID=A0A1V8TGK8_9PEZI|nr:hypothetical protein B0A48_03677 [Cryoendolithus antarcticus]
MSTPSTKTLAQRHNDALDQAMRKLRKICTLEQRTGPFPHREAHQYFILTALKDRYCYEYECRFGQNGLLNRVYRTSKFGEQGIIALMPDILRRETTDLAQLGTPVVFDRNAVPPVFHAAPQRGYDHYSPRQSLQDPGRDPRDNSRHPAQDAGPVNASRMPGKADKLQLTAQPPDPASNLPRGKTAQTLHLAAQVTLPPQTAEEPLIGDSAGDHPAKRRKTSPAQPQLQDENAHETDSRRKTFPAQPQLQDENARETDSNPRKDATRPALKSVSHNIQRSPVFASTSTIGPSPVTAQAHASLDFIAPTPTLDHSPTRQKPPPASSPAPAIATSSAPPSSPLLAAIPALATSPAAATSPNPAVTPALAASPATAAPATSSAYVTSDAPATSPAPSPAKLQTSPCSSARILHTAANERNTAQEEEEDDTYYFHNHGIPNSYARYQAQWNMQPTAPPHHPSSDIIPDSMPIQSSQDEIAAAVEDPEDRIPDSMPLRLPAQSSQDQDGAAPNLPDDRIADSLPPASSSSSPFPWPKTQKKVRRPTAKQLKREPHPLDLVVQRLRNAANERMRTSPMLPSSARSARFTQNDLTSEGSAIFPSLPTAAHSMGTRPAYTRRPPPRFDGMKDWGSVSSHIDREMYGSDGAPFTGAKRPRR